MKREIELTILLLFILGVAVLFFFVFQAVYMMGYANGWEKALTGAIEMGVCGT